MYSMEMRIQQVPLHEVFTATDFRMPGDFLTLTLTRTWFTCAQCRQAISFSMRDFLRHVDQQFTNLRPEDDHLIDEFSRDHLQIPPGYFLDFYCPKCASAYRLYYRADELVGGRGAWRVQLIALLTKD